MLRLFKFIAVAAVLAATLGCLPHADQERPSARTAQPLIGPVESATPPKRREPDLAARLAALAPEADPQVIRLALQAQSCAVSTEHIADQVERLAVIDYSRPSTQRRLWVFDLVRERLLYREYVAHGRNTGGDIATRFSNDEGSLQSSLGLFLTAGTYQGENGYSLRMDGLEPGINDRARARAIVMHGAWYVDPVQARAQGRLGRSLGCPALRPDIAHAVIDALKQGQMVFAYYPDDAWLSSSRYLGCRAHEQKAARAADFHAADG